METEVIPDYIEARIRKPIPKNSHVILGSTPVIAFGNARKARIATLGLNPSKREFLDHRGIELNGRNRRLETLSSLGVNTLVDAPDAAIRRVFDACNNYFLSEHNPYWKWFGPLEQLLLGVKGSYKDGSACHLDLVQWATDPVWGEIKLRSVLQSLLKADQQFLLSQLTQEQIETLFLNGRRVINELKRSLNISLHETRRTVSDLGVTTKFFIGLGPRSMKIVGWSTNLQSSRGVSNCLRQYIAEEVAGLVLKLH